MPPMLLMPFHHCWKLSFLSYRHIVQLIGLFCFLPVLYSNLQIDNLIFPVLYLCLLWFLRNSPFYLWHPDAPLHLPIIHIEFFHHNFYQLLYSFLYILLLSVPAFYLTVLHYSLHNKVYPIASNPL